jgi:hypothetical protein
MGNRQSLQPDVAQQEDISSPPEVTKEEFKSLPVLIPKTGQNAYVYNDNSTKNRIGEGGFSNVFIAIRNYD